GIVAGRALQVPKSRMASCPKAAGSMRLSILECELREAVHRLIRPPTRKIVIDDTRQRLCVSLPPGPPPKPLDQRINAAAILGPRSLPRRIVLTKQRKQVVFQRTVRCELAFASIDDELSASAFRDLQEKIDGRRGTPLGHEPFKLNELRAGISFQRRSDGARLRLCGDGRRAKCKDAGKRNEK